MTKLAFKLEKDDIKLLHYLNKQDCHLAKFLMIFLTASLQLDRKEIEDFEKSDEFKNMTECK